MSDQKRASFATADMSKGGGLFDDLDVTYNADGTQFTTDPPSEDYNVEGNPIFAVLSFTADGADAASSQSYSLGAKAGDKFDISEDGQYLIPKHESAKIAASSKFGKFLSQLEQEGFPMGLIGGSDGELRKIDKLRAHVNQIPDEVRKGLKMTEKQTKYPPSTLCVTRILNPEIYSGGKAAPKAAKPAAGKTATKTAPAKPATGALSDEDIQSGVTALTTVLAAKGGSVQRSQLPLLLVRELASNTKRQEITKYMHGDAGLALELGWSFDPSSNPQVVNAA